MKQAAEYRRLAAECRTLARTAKTDEERVQLLKMAQVWETLAKHREAAQRG